MRLVIYLCILFAIQSCSTEVVKKESTETQEIQKPKIDSLELKYQIKRTDKLSNGIEISWYQQGTGKELSDGDVAIIDYKVRLADSTIVDGNHLLNKESMPFMIGFEMQTTGWDIAFTKLRVGDIALIKLPSQYARGKKGIKGLIPPDAENYLTVRILGIEKPTRQVDGCKVYLFEENKSNKKKFNEKNAISFLTIMSSKSSPRYYDSFKTNSPFTLRLEDNGVVPGLKKALINAKKGDRMFVYVPPQEAYGSKGYLDIVKPNEAIFYNVLVTDVLD